MTKYKLQVKNEIFYLFLLLVITVFFNNAIFSTNKIFLITLAILGIFLLETWFIRTFRYYSSKKISKYSDIIVKISLKDRFLAYFIFPEIFYISLLAFLYFNRTEILAYFVIGVAMCLILVLFLNVKSSLNKIYTIENATRSIFDFINISIFYLILNILVRINIQPYIFVISTFILSIILLLFSLKMHKRLGWMEVLISILSTTFIILFTLIFFNYGIFIIPAIGTLAFYLILSLWNIRFAGKIHLKDYVPPFLYVTLAIILVLNI